MQSQRKKFNYLSNYNSINSIATNSDSMNGKSAVTEYRSRAGSINSNRKYRQNIALYNNKENMPEQILQPIKLDLQSTQLFQKQQPNKPDVSDDQKEMLKEKVMELQKIKEELVKSTEEKFRNLESHLGKVESILEEKQNCIKNLIQSNEKLIDEKAELVSIINLKNKEIKCLSVQLQELEKSRSQESQKSIEYQRHDQIYPHDDEISNLAKITFLQVQTQTQIGQMVENISDKSQLQSNKQCSETQVQTDCNIPKQISQECSVEVQTEHREAFNQNTDEISSKINYRQKYEKLFKKALEMEDEVYQLKENLFDSQNQVKAVQQEFNTYKILHQIDQITAD